MLRLDTRFLQGFPEALRQHAPLLEEARERLLAKRKAPGAMLGWMDLPEDTETLREVRRYREASPWVEDFVLIGIGGSALGPKALEAAFRESGVRFHYVDHVEPEPVLRLLRTLDPGKTLVNAVSKSGSTAETLAGLAVFLDWLKAHLGEAWRRHLVVTTDPKEGPLRAFAEREGLKAFAIPPRWVGASRSFPRWGFSPWPSPGLTWTPSSWGPARPTRPPLPPWRKASP